MYITVQLYKYYHLYRYNIEFTPGPDIPAYESFAM